MNIKGSVALHGHNQQLRLCSFCYAGPSLCSTVWDYCQREKAWNTFSDYRDYKVKRGQYSTEVWCTTFTIRNEYIYFASSLTCSWVIYCPRQREKRSGEQLHVNRLEMTQIPPDHWSRRDAAWACHQHPATIPYRPTVPFCLHLPSPALLHSSKATTTGRLIK